MTDAPLSEAGIAKAQSLADAYGMYSDERGLLSGYLSHALADVRRLRAAGDIMLEALAMGPLELAAKYGPDVHPDEAVVDAAFKLRAALGMKENEHG